MGLSANWIPRTLRDFQVLSQKPNNHHIGASFFLRAKFTSMLFDPGTLEWQSPNSGSLLSLLPKYFLCQKPDPAHLVRSLGLPFIIKGRFIPIIQEDILNLWDYSRPRRKIAQPWTSLNLAHIFLGTGREVFPEYFYRGGEVRDFIFYSIGTSPPSWESFLHEQWKSKHRFPETVWVSASSSWLTDNFPRKTASLTHHHPAEETWKHHFQHKHWTGHCKAIPQGILLIRISEASPTPKNIV